MVLIVKWDAPTCRHFLKNISPYTNGQARQKRGKKKKGGSGGSAAKKKEGLARMAEVPRRLGDADRVVANKR